MDDHLNSKGLCHVCREAMTTIHAEVAPGLHIFVCEKCLETAKQNFIWVCMQCGSVFIRPKSLVVKRLRGVGCCTEGGPEEMMEYVAAAKGEKNGGHA